MSGSNVDCQTVLTRGQFLPPLYAVYHSKDAPQRPNEVVQIGRGRATNLVFTTMDAARNAAEWISSSHPSSLGGQPLVYERGLPVGARRYTIDTGDDACAKQDFVKAKAAKAAAANSAR